jgi:hypothetical protein
MSKKPFSRFRFPTIAVSKETKSEICKSVIGDNLIKNIRFIAENQIAKLTDIVVHNDRQISIKCQDGRIEFKVLVQKLNPPS